MRLVASSRTACVGCKSSLAETNGNSRTSTKTRARRALLYGTTGNWEVSRFFRKNARNAASAIVTHTRLRSSSIKDDCISLPANSLLAHLLDRRHKSIQTCHSIKMVLILCKRRVGALIADEVAAIDRQPIS